MRPSQILKVALGLAITVFCVWSVAKHVNVDQFLASLRAADYRLVLGAVVCYMLSMVVRSLRLHFLLRPLKRVPVQNLFPIIIVGYAANNLLPFRVGEVVRAYFTGKQEGISASSSLAVIIVERIFDGLTVALILALGLLTMTIGNAEEMAELRLVLYLGGGAFLGAFLVCMGLVFQRDRTLSLMERIFSWETIGISEKVMPIIHKLVSGLEVLTSATDSLIVLVLSLAVWVCEGLMYTLVGLSLGFGDQVSFMNELVVLAIVNLAIMVPSAPGFAGTFEKAGTWALSKFGVAHDPATAYTVLIHLGQYLPTTILGLFFMWKYNISLTRAQAEEEKALEQESAAQ